MIPYTLRHYFISYCIMSGIKILIAKWCGHRDTRMIERVYGHLAPDYSADEMAKLQVTPNPAPPIQPAISAQENDSEKIDIRSIPIPSEESEITLVKVG